MEKVYRELRSSLISLFSTDDVLEIIFSCIPKKMSIHDVKFMFTTRTVLLCVMIPVTSQFKHNNLKPSVVAELQKPLRPIYKI